MTEHPGSAGGRLSGDLARAGEDDGRRHRPATIDVTAFVDWKTQMHDARALGLDPPQRARSTLARTTKAVGRALARLSGARFRVSFRLYHGWHKG